jgi:hypothetical protein
MDARIVRIKKEGRMLFWPWCAVTVMGALPFLLPHSSTAAKLNMLSFFFGLPLLATLSLGNEFYHRTFSLWLSQPVSRMQLWSEKTSVMSAAVLSAGVVTGFAMFVVALPTAELTYNKAAAAAYVLIIAASAPFWTLAARSTLGGFVLIEAIWWMFYAFVRKAETGELRVVPSPTTAAITALCVACAALMLWLGARKLTRFQVTGGSSGQDLLMAGPSLMPETLAEWFRCRPSGTILNLIRKEFRLLRPLWVIELLVFVYTLFLAIFRLLPVPPVSLPETVRQWALLGPPAMACLGLAGLAGILSLGEERTSGTHAWHMTLPVSTRTVWLVKLLVAMLAGLACAMLLPLLAMLIVGSAYGSPFMFVYLPALPAWLVLYPILTFAWFWCACTANGTVRAATWAMPVIAAIPFASAGGRWLGEELAHSTGTLRDFVVSSLHLSPLAFTTIADLARSEILWLFIPTLLVALIQSYWLFRTPAQNRNLWMLRCLLPLVAVTFLSSFIACAGFLSSPWEPFEEIRRALDRLQPTTATLEMTGVELAKGAPLSSLTRRWLTGSSIALAPDDSRPSMYRATIHLASGLQCRLIVIQSGGMAASCGKV